MEAMGKRGKARALGTFQGEDEDDSDGDTEEESTTGLVEHDLKSERRRSRKRKKRQSRRVSDAKDTLDVYFADADADEVAKKEATVAKEKDDLLKALAEALADQRREQHERDIKEEERQVKRDENLLEMNAANMAAIMGLMMTALAESTKRER